MHMVHGRHKGLVPRLYCRCACEHLLEALGLKIHEDHGDTVVQHRVNYFHGISGNDLDSA